jgi:hypothetical protein
MTKTENVASEAGFTDCSNHHMRRTVEEEHPSYATFHLEKTPEPSHGGRRF